MLQNMERESQPNVKCNSLCGLVSQYDIAKSFFRPSETGSASYS